MTLLALLALTVLLLAPLYIIYKPPQFVIRRFQRKWPDVLFQASSLSSKTVALTIDDAPSSPVTREILQLLAANDAHATFFVIGAQVAGREDVLRDVVRAGHELGNHAMHDEPSRALSDGTLVEQIHAVEEMIGSAYAAAGAPAPSEKLFRPGSGFFSERMRRSLARLGYHLVLGSIYPHDPQLSVWWINARHVLSMLRPGGIIVCHDRRSWTVPMLGRVLPEMKKRGYRVVTVSELLEEEKKEKEGTKT